MVSEFLKINSHPAFSLAAILLLRNYNSMIKVNLSMLKCIWTRFTTLSHVNTHCTANVQVNPANHEISIFWLIQSEDQVQGYRTITQKVKSKMQAPWFYTLLTYLSKYHNCYSEQQSSWLSSPGCYMVYIKNLVVKPQWDIWVWKAQCRLLYFSEGSYS